MGRPRKPHTLANLRWILALALGAAAASGCARFMGGADPGVDATDASTTAPDASTLSPDAEASEDGGAPCTGTPEVAPQGDLTGDTWQAVQLDACRAGAHVAAGAAGQQLRLRLRGASAPLSITIHNDHGELLASDTVPAGADAADLPIAVDDGGGLQVAVLPADPSLPLGYEIRLGCESGCDLEATRYPLVLVHGAGGPAYFGSVEYFFGIEDDLGALGYRVFTPLVSSWAHSRDRAQELAAEIDAILAETGASRVHLIGHSQAGLDFRVLLSPQGLGYDDRVATATSISTPHSGLHPSYAGMSSYFGMDVTESYVSGEFAQLFPEPPGALRFSWAAATCGAYELTCLDTYDDEVVAAGLASSYLSLRSLYGNDGQGGDNDGVVPVTTAVWGTFLGILAADHWDLVGQIPMQRLGTFDAPAFYRDEARRLRALEIDHSL